MAEIIDLTLPDVVDLTKEDEEEEAFPPPVLPETKEGEAFSPIVSAVIERRSTKRKFTDWNSRIFPNRTGKFRGWKYVNENTKNNNDECTICYSKHRLESWVETTCGHQFGFKCINRWLNKEDTTTCPICRKVIVNE
jgi:hypothetical protein